MKYESVLLFLHRGRFVSPLRRSYQSSTSTHPRTVSTRARLKYIGRLSRHRAPGENQASAAEHDCSIGWIRKCFGQTWYGRSKSLIFEVRFKFHGFLLENPFSLNAEKNHMHTPTRDPVILSSPVGTISMDSLTRLGHLNLSRGTPPIGELTGVGLREFSKSHSISTFLKLDVFFRCENCDIFLM